VTLAVLAGTIVGAVLVYAGVAKMLSFGRWLAAARALGVPRALATVVPFFEGVVGLGVVIGGTWTLGFLVVATAMLVIFTVLLGVHMRKDERPPCMCFGGATERPIGARDIVRNIVLLVLVFVAIAS
jgi:uncharacterized membrane protein YphA (DoxX/SURF4 family)